MKTDKPFPNVSISNSLYYDILTVAEELDLKPYEVVHRILQRPYDRELNLRLPGMRFTYSSDGSVELRYQER